MDMVVYQIRYRKFCSKRERNSVAFCWTPIKGSDNHPTEPGKKNVKRTYIVSQNYAEFPGVVLGIDGAQPVHNNKNERISI